MTKLQFLLVLQDRLSGLPQNDVEERLNFYSEMIEDRMEDGLTEEQAVMEIGTVDEIAAQIIADVAPIRTEKKKRAPERKLRVWEIVLLALGSPIWLSLLIAAFAIALSLYVSLWTVIISIWAIFASLIACNLGSIIAGVGFIFGGYPLSGILMLGASAVCAGLAILFFLGSHALTKGTALLTKKIAHGIKNKIRKGRIA